MVIFHCIKYCSSGIYITVEPSFFNRQDYHLVYGVCPACDYTLEWWRASQTVTDDISTNFSSYFKRQTVRALYANAKNNDKSYDKIEVNYLQFSLLNASELLHLHPLIHPLIHPLLKKV